MFPDDKNIQNAPIPVEFAGLRGTTYSMGRAGWDLSVQQGFDRERYCISLRVAGWHSRLNAKCFSNPLYLQPSELQQFYWHDLIQPVQLRAVAETINLPVVDSNLKAMPFAPVDFRPQEASFRDLVRNFDDICIFKPLNDDLEIIVPEYSVPDLQKMILERQEPKQKEIRERLRKEQEREPNKIIPYSRSNIKIQVVTG